MQQRFQLEAQRLKQEDIKLIFKACGELMQVTEGVGNGAQVHESFSAMKLRLVRLVLGETGEVRKQRLASTPSYLIPSLRPCRRTLVGVYAGGKPCMQTSAQCIWPALKPPTPSARLMVQLVTCTWQQGPEEFLHVHSIAHVHHHHFLETSRLHV
jgi:hypothetical protein